MREPLDRTLPRADIDARARIARLVLERDAVALGVPSRRLLAVASLADLWRQLIRLAPRRLGLARRLERS